VGFFSYIYLYIGSSRKINWAQPNK